MGAPGARAARRVVAEPIPPGVGRLSLVNDTNRAQFEALVANGEYRTRYAETGRGRVLLAQRDVRPGASVTITDYFTTGAFAVVCVDQRLSPAPPELVGPSPGTFALVGPIVVP